MSTTARLAFFWAGLAVVLGAALVAGGSVVPPHVASSWARAIPNTNVAGHKAGSQSVRGVSLSQGGLMLGDVAAPSAAGVSGTLSFRIETLAGVPVTKFDTENTKQLHLIVVRSDGAEFRHVHPTMNVAGQWSIPWTWKAAGTYRIFADFVPAAATGKDTGAGTGRVLSYALEVGGCVTPRRATTVSTVSRVDGFAVAIDGAFRAEAVSKLTVTVTRDGQPVTTLQPYLGAYGHLVALREGDLAYLHAHAVAAEPTAGRVGFLAEGPTPGRYLVYLDFEVAGRVHTAQFVLNAEPPTAAHN
ncbi:hypothetical protein [Mycobacterium decipiens]|uniref:Heavy metal-binding domain-containing protein n=1 Tax=Mycobacterium decipiens TaxID=1430326 RepID=A0A1X2LQX0_9MYCO|nr:hypothetical protein [Mycobacterium decipiens]OSC38819.1 hypothetical protein B8W66_19085 [Mycobacterium decipiens]